MTSLDVKALNHKSLNQQIRTVENEAQLINMQGQHFIAEGADGTTVGR